MCGQGEARPSQGRGKLGIAGAQTMPRVSRMSGTHLPGVDQGRQAVQAGCSEGQQCLLPPQSPHFIPNSRRKIQTFLAP